VHVKFLFLKLHPIYFLDACLAEEESTPDRLVLFFSFPSSPKSAPYSSGGTAPGTLHGIHLMGPGELPYTRLAPLIAVNTHPCPLMRTFLIWWFVCISPISSKGKNMPVNSASHSVRCSGEKMRKSTRKRQFVDSIPPRVSIQ
jgi:hypothetical protein